MNSDVWGLPAVDIWHCACCGEFLDPEYPAFLLSVGDDDYFCSDRCMGSFSNYLGSEISLEDCGCET